VQLAQADERTVVLADVGDLAFTVIGSDLFTRWPEVEAVDGFVVFADVVVALRAASVVVERDTRRNHVDHRGSLVRQCRLDQRNELRLVAGKTATDESGAHYQCQHD